MLLQVLADLLWVSAASLCPPFGKWSWWVSVVKVGLSIVIKTGDKSTDTEWSDTTLLSVLLLCLCDVLWNVLDWWIIVVVQSVWLTFDSCLIGQDSSIGCETWKSHVNMLVELDNFLYGSAFLQLGNGFFLHYNFSYLNSENDWWVGHKAHRTETLLNGFDGILDLEKMSIGWEDCNGCVVHLNFF